MRIICILFRTALRPETFSVGCVRLWAASKIGLPLGPRDVRRMLATVFAARIWDYEKSHVESFSRLAF